MLTKGIVLIPMKFPYSCHSQLSITHSPFRALIPSFLNGHWVVFVFSLVAVWGTTLSALAGSYFEIIIIPQETNATVNISGTIGIGYNNLSNIFTPFVAAAGVSTFTNCVLFRQ